MQRDLVEAAKGGDHEAFEVLAKSSADRLYAIARLILRDADLAQDAVQETLIRSWRGLPGLRDPARFEAWLHRLLVNCCTDQARGRQRLTANVRVIDLPDPDDSKLVADRDQLERGFRRLKLEQRTLVVMRYYLGLSLPELADTLSLPLGTVKSQLHYAMEALRAALEADLRPGSELTGKTA